MEGSCAQQLSYAAGRYNHENAETRATLRGMDSGLLDLKEALQDFLNQASPPYLEVGPLYTPLLLPDSGIDTVYWDMDLTALKRLDANGKRVHPMYIDLNYASETYVKDFVAWNNRLLEGLRASHGYGAIVIAQVFNYVDFRKLLRLVQQFQKPGGWLFVTNQVNLGDHAFFHPTGRPRTDSDLEHYVRSIGYNVIRYQEYGFSNDDHKQVTVIARKR
ncbi:MAG: hypothetical protein AB7G93_10270 [Bdellovibrionales bacterium]